MKKTFLLIFAIVFALTGCTEYQPDDGSAEDSVSVMHSEQTEESGVIQTDCRPMALINGVLYLDTGKESTLDRKCGTPDGTITDSVEQTQRPVRNDQSNFGTGFVYQTGTENTVDILIRGKWIIFEAAEENTLSRTESGFRADETVFLNPEQAGQIRDMLEQGSLEEGTPDCLPDYIFWLDGQRLWYHSECGTFLSDAMDTEQHLTLPEEEKQKLQLLLESWMPKD